MKMSNLKIYSMVESDTLRKRGFLMEKLLRWLMLSMVIWSACTATQTPMSESPIETQTPSASIPALTSPVESPVSASEQAAGEEIAAALKPDLADKLGVDVKTLHLVSMKAVEWRDASLGCPQPDEMYAQVITPGWQFIFEDEAGNTYDVRAPQGGKSFVVCEDGAQPRPTPSTGTIAPERVIETAKRFVAERKDLSVTALSVEQAEAVEWRNGCLECAGVNEMCTMVITPGYRIILRAGGARYEVHTDESGSSVRLCGGAGKETAPSSVSDDVWIMHKDVLAFLNDEYPGFGLAQLPPPWQAEDVTEPGKLGVSRYKFTNMAWEIIYACPVVAEPQCDVLLWHVEAQQLWQGTVIGDGEIEEVSESPALTYEVGPCDEALTGEALESWAGATITPTVDGFEFVHRIPYVCCADIVASVSLDTETDTLRIVETNRGEVCRCKCGYEMTGSVTGLADGRYAVEFWGVQKSDFHPLTLLVTMETEIP